jgi:hypothetical protein
MPRGENLTLEMRRRGGRNGGPARAANIREQKAADARRIEEAYRERLDKMFAKLDAIIDNDEDPATQLRAILAAFDRLAGKPLQVSEHSGNVDHTIVTAEAREYLARRLADQARRSIEREDP